MNEPWKPPGPSALDDTEWPDKLIAKAIEPGAADDRLHGYAVVADVARNYAYSDLVFLSIVGELPDDRSSKLFHLAMCSLATPAISEAPSHVSLLSRICGGSIGSALASGLITLTEQARDTVASHADLLAWLANPDGQPPSSTSDPSDGPWIDTLRATLQALGLEVASVRAGMTRAASRIALLYEAGLRDPDKLEAAFVVSRVPGIAAEALLAGPPDLPLYPVKLPPFHYVEGQEEP